ncbi:MAG: hypothetical protein IH987_02885 [Planctomycetes bacterium]|nr:hypothetical protein [Planctomycetota bacterium]
MAFSDSTDTLAGPNELLDSFLEPRNAADSTTHGAISNEGIRHLVLLAYYASQAVEEGRFPRFRMYVSPADYDRPSSEDSWQLLRFSKPIMLDNVDDLRRLAPCASSHDLVLDIQEQCSEEGRSRLLCVGVRMAHSGEGEVTVLSSSLWARRMRPGVMIRVDGPGAIRVSEAERAVDLRAGKMNSFGSMPVHPLQTWQDEIASRLAKHTNHERHLQHTVGFAWNELLQDVSSLQRGGCFVVLPKKACDIEDLETQYHIRLKYPTSGPALGESIAAFVALCSPPAGAPVDGELAAANLWMRQRYALTSMLKSLARASGVDGCTVFDRDLTLLGFGGKIKAPSDDTTKHFKDVRTNLWASREVVRRLGTRHQSAFSLCDHHAGTYCYVVSQDGDATLFWSDHDTTHQWKPYWPWGKRSDQF